MLVFPFASRWCTVLDPYCLVFGNKWSASARYGSTGQTSHAIVGSDASTISPLRPRRPGRSCDSLRCLLVNPAPPRFTANAFSSHTTFNANSNCPIPVRIAVSLHVAD